jgi:hypothetical protein
MPLPAGTVKKATKYKSTFLINFTNNVTTNYSGYKKCRE